MGDMPPNQPLAEVDATPESVIEFGPPAPARRRRFRTAAPGRGPGGGWGRGPAGGWGRGLAGDRRVVPLAAALGAVAAFASLISEWQVTVVGGSAYGSGELSEKLIPADLGDLGAFGAGYLAGLFLLIAAVVLTMFGPVAGRRYARLAGLSVGGTLLALVLALTSILGDQSRIVSRLYALEIDGGHLRLSYGRGLWCALFAVVAALIALYLAERHLPAVDSSAVATEPGRPEPPAVWSWRRPQPGEDEQRPDEPFELTVSSAKPFTPAEADRDKPRRSGRPGISE
jgi:hypothetical protein